MAVAKGEDCFSIISRALQCIQQRKPKAASKYLARVKKDGAKLKEFSQAILNKLESAEQHHIEREEELMENVGELAESVEKKKNELKATQKRSDLRIRQLEEDREENERKLKIAESELQKAQKQVNDAQRLLEAAEKEREKNKGFSAGAGVGSGVAAGVAVGAIAGPLGAVIGGVAGAFVGAATGIAIGDAISGVEKAEANLKQAKECSGMRSCKLRDCKTAVQECIQERDREISRLSNKISTLEKEIGLLDQERTRCHDEVGTIRELIVFLKKASVFWSEFEIAVNSGTGRTDLLQTLMDRATAKDQSYLRRFFRSLGLQTSVSSFIEAWNEVENIVRDGNLPYLHFTDDDDLLDKQISVPSIRARLERREANRDKAGTDAWCTKYKCFCTLFFIFIFIFFILPLMYFACTLSLSPASVPVPMQTYFVQAALD